MSNNRARTVNDFKSTRALRKALKSVDEEQPLSDDEQQQQQREDEEKLNENWDWVLTNYDVGATVPQSISQELHRLQVLKSYLILDDDREESFDRLTNMASRIFDVPIAVVSLVDLGRQWFMSNHGLGDVRETPRNVAFCAHAIQMSKDEVLIVENALEDPRFCDSPLVQGAPFIRFYAGAPLLSPEGYKLGTFCIIDSKPRPQGMTADEQENLKDFAAMAMKCMVDRRKITAQDDTAHIVACTAHDLLTPLMGVQLSLSLLEEDPTLADAHRESLSNAIRSSDWLHRICETTMETLRDNPSAQGKTTCPWLNLSQCADTSTLPPCTCGHHHSSADHNGSNSATYDNPFIDMQHFVNSLNQTMESIPKRVPLIVTVDQSVPARIVSDELKLFRSSLNLLSNALASTTTGSVHFHIRRSAPTASDQSFLVFECTDTGRDLQISEEDDKCLFKPCKKSLGVVKDLGLYSVAYQVDSLGGSYGYRPRAQEGQRGSVFWFKIPIVLPEDVSVAGGRSFGNLLVDDETLDSAVHRFPPAMVRSSSFRSTTSLHSRRNSSANLLVSAEERSAGLLAVAAAAATCKATSSSNSCCGLEEIAKYDSIDDYKQHQRKLRSDSESHDERATTTTIGSSARENGADNKVLGGNLFGGEVKKIENGDNSAAKNNETPSSLFSLAPKSGAPPALFSLVSQRTVQLPNTPSSLFSLGTKTSTSQGLPRTIVISNTDHGKDAAEQKPWNSSGENGGRQKKALVIEDTVVVRKTLTRALQKRGYEVTQANDGVEGLDALKSTVFDITLCDFLMPNMDGLDCVTAYREWEKSNLPLRQYIVGISAHCSQKDVDKGLEVGMNGFRSKPITMKILQELDESSDMVLVRQQLDRMHVDSDQQSPIVKDSFSSPSENQYGTGSNVTVQKKSCLMATARPDAEVGLAKKMVDEGWDVTIVKTGVKALDSLKLRNWGAVVLDDELPGLSGNECVAEFRAWECQNRVNRQDNLFIVCTHVMLSNPDTCMLPPAGFDGAVDRKVSWSHLQSLIARHKTSDSVFRSGLSIVTR
jgi:CheY-like chemotaxis protein